MKTETVRAVRQIVGNLVVLGLYLLAAVQYVSHQYEAATVVLLLIISILIADTNTRRTP